MKHALSLCILGGALAACKKPPPPLEDKPPPAASITSAAAAAPPPEPPEAPVPTLSPEPFAPTKRTSVRVHVIDGAVLVSEGLRVGRIEGEDVKWFGQIPDDNKDLDPQGNEVRAVWGSWPDAVDVYYLTKNRQARPTVYPLTGKGSRRTFGADETGAWMHGWARVGATTIVAAGDPWTGRHRAVIRGPARQFEPISAEKGGCKPEEVPKSQEEPVPLALPYWGIGATGAGTFMTLGQLCNREKAWAAEVWDREGTSRIVDLHDLIQDVRVFLPASVPGKGDELWLHASPVIHYNAGTFEALPPIGWPLQRLFVSPSGKLHAYAGRGIFRFDDGHWTRIANLPHPMLFKSMGMDGEGTFWVWYGSPSRLRAFKGETIDGACATPFVYVGEVPLPREPPHAFPDTEKALATFPALSEISPVGYVEHGAQHVGVTVKSMEQGRALVAHLRANAPDPRPELICFAPKIPTVIELKGN